MQESTFYTRLIWQKSVVIPGVSIPFLQTKTSEVKAEWALALLGMKTISAYELLESIIVIYSQKQIIKLLIVPIVLNYYRSLVFVGLFCCFNIEFSKMFKSSKVKTRKKLFSYLAFRTHYQNRIHTSTARRLRFTFPWQEHRNRVPALANQNSCTMYEPYVSVLTDCRWLLSS